MNTVVKKDSEISPPRRGGRGVKFFIKTHSELCVLCGESSFTVNPKEPNILSGAPILQRLERLEHLERMEPRSI